VARRTPPSPSDLAPPPPGRARALLVLVLLLGGAWLLRWTEALGAEGVVHRRGPALTGGVGAAALAVLWGLGATALLSRTRSALLAGASATDAVLAGLLAALVAQDHPWAGGLPALAVASSAALALLAVLDAAVSLAGRGGGGVAAIRTTSALVLAFALALERAWLPAALALWLALAPALLRRARGRVLPRRALAALLLLASLAALAAPDLHALLVPVEEAAGTFEGRYAWRLLSVALALLSLAGIAAPAGREDGRA